MAYIWKNVDVEVEVDVEPDEWFDEAYDSERKKMYEICKEYFEAEEVLVRKKTRTPSTIQEQEFLDKIDELEARYLSLTAEQINLLMSI